MRLLGFLSVLLVSTAVEAATITMVWDISNPSVPDDLPVRVEKASKDQIWLFDREPSLVTVAAMQRGIDTHPFTDADSPKVYTADSWFSSDGSLAVFVPGSEREQPYVSRFDVDSRTFRPEAYPLSGLAGFATGKSEISVFVNSGQQGRFQPPPVLELYKVTHDGTAFQATRLWEGTEFTEYVASDMNARGDVAAIVAKAVTAPRGLGLVYERHAVLVRSADGRVTQREMDWLKQGSTIALSEDGEWVAVGRGDLIRVYAAASLTLKHSVLVGACQPAEKANVWRLAIGNDQTIGGVLLGPSGWEIIVATEQVCTKIATYDFDEIAQINLALLPQKRLYLAATGRLSPRKATAQVIALE